MSDLSTNLVLFLELNRINDGTVLDKSNRGNNAEVEANPGLIPNTSFGSVMTFNGSNDYLNLGNTTLNGALAQGSTQFTVSAWVNPSELNSTQSRHKSENTFFAQSSANDNDNDILEIGIDTAGNLTYYIDESHTNSGRTLGSGELIVNKWHFVALVFNSGQVTAYLDGNVYEDSLTGTSLAAGKGSLVTVGCTTHDMIFFTGKMSHLRVFNRALTAKEVGEVMDEDLSNEDLLYLMLNELNGDQLTDRSPAKNPVTVFNDPQIVLDDTFGSSLLFNGTNQYAAVDQLFFSELGQLPELTVQAWVKTTATGPITLASWDPKEYFRFAIGKESGKVLFATTDELGSTDELDSDSLVNDGEWHHIAGTFESGTGNKRIYIDGKLDKETKVGNGLPLGTGEKRYGFIGTDSNADNFNGSQGDSPAYFEGRMAHFRMYSQALDQSEIQVAMAADLTSVAAFRRAFPIVFDLVQENRASTLFIFDDPGGHNMDFQIMNTAGTPLTLVGMDQADADHFHFALSFRPGTLSQESIDILTLAQSDFWNFGTPEIQENRALVLYFSSKSNLTFVPKEVLTLTLQNVSADFRGGSRGSRVELEYQGLSQPEGNSLLTGLKEIQIGIINHAGQQDIPLQVTWLGSNSVLNVALGPQLPESELTLVVANIQSEDPNVTGLKFNATGEKGASGFIITVDAFDPQNPTEWGLGSTDVVKEIVISQTDLNGGVNWNIDVDSSGISPVWTLIPQSDFVLAPGDRLHFLLSKVSSDATNGPTNLYVNYQNIPGFFDGQFINIIQKGPVEIRGSQVGLATSNIQSLLHMLGGDLTLQNFNDQQPRGILFKNSHDDFNWAIRRVDVGQDPYANLVIAGGNASTADGLKPYLTLDRDGDLIVSSENVIVSIDGRVNGQNGMKPILQLSGAKDVNNTSFGQLDFMNFDSGGKKQSNVLVSLRGERSNVDAGQFSVYTGTADSLTQKLLLDHLGTLTLFTGSGSLKVNARGTATNSRKGELTIIGAINKDGDTFGVLNFNNFDNSGLQSENSLVSLKAERDGTDGGRFTVYTGEGDSHKKRLDIDNSGWTTLYGGLTIQPQKKVLGIPIIDFKHSGFTFTAPVSGQLQTFVRQVTFDSNVLMAEVMLQKWRLNYPDGKSAHSWRTGEVGLTLVIDPNNQKAVNVTITIGLSDSKTANNFPNSYEGSVDFVVIARVEKSFDA